MSIAGIRSNRGDGYQTLVAFNWALTVLSDPDYQWIEVDSVSYLVDDVVIGKADGTLICCQCKKNQPNCKAWTVADLAGELEKASSLLAADENAEVHFYSRSSFSKLAKLREHTTTQPDEKNYRVSLGKEHQTVDAALAAKIVTQAPNLSTYEFLCRTTFETSCELDRMNVLLYERLRYMVSNPKAAYNALWTKIDQLGGRMSGKSASTSHQHRLTKEDLKAILQQAGAMLVPPMNLAEVRASFSSTSAIGRSWQRDIAGERIPSPTVDKILTAIDDGKKTILLTGLPGSGKTCVILAVQEALEQRAKVQTDLVALFIQTREFADLLTAQERQAQGLPEQWVEQAVRMAEEARMVVVIDSLDVLSIAREHSILAYFLAQIDRLLLIPNITVVTACRDFDRQYDRRIAERQWDCEFKCPSLDWESEVAPLLNTFGIHTESIDAVTRGLIENPRELALFVELAQRGERFNVVTSQALAQRYLDAIVCADKMLGETAMQAIESVAAEMLKSRSLAIPQQRFTASKDIQKALCSLNVLQKTQDGKLTFGHQTLLDVLVISGAVRQGITLNKFIQSLPPVPFVRPSIRSFVAQLATGERSEFRKQLRTVLTGNAAFHIRRLVAESFAEQIPQDGDWPLIRDLRNKHRELFQVIYTQTVQVDWHHFWLKHLIPVLMDAQDADGLEAHVYRVSQWKNEKAESVLQFWVKALSLDWFDGDEIADQLGFFLSKMDTKNLALAVPLLERLLNMPQQEHGLLGHIIARCVTAGVVDDGWLWRYVAGDVDNDDVIKCQLGNKLRCLPHEIGDNDDNFFCQRMKQSTALLDLALESIEHWSLAGTSRNNICRSYHSRFLKKTSYDDVHSQSDMRHVGSENILLGAIEAAILKHSQEKSDWWQCNRERLCFNHEGALRYFAILALTTDPQANIDLVERMLCDKKLLESDLSYELGTLMKMAFIYLEASSQYAIMACVLTLWDGKTVENEHQHFWILKKQAELIVTIPCYLRSSEAQTVLSAYEKREGVLIRLPDIWSWNSAVSAPFSYELFLGSSDSGVLRLLAHYAEQGKNFEDCGDREVGWQLREAASRDPIRFLQLLPTHWGEISKRFCDNIMGGVAAYLNQRYSNLQANGSLVLMGEPDATVLADYILDELERHPSHWYHNRAASDALKACAYVIQETENAARLVFMAIGFANIPAENTIQGDSRDLITKGINMAGGNIANALMILVCRLQEYGIPFPTLLSPTLCRFAGHQHPAIRALILRYLPDLQSQNPALGWELFKCAMQNDATGLWQIAERYLYDTYHNNFEKVGPLLDCIPQKGSKDGMETWGRISALAALSNLIDFVVWLEKLKALNIAEAWLGAVDVWMQPENFKQYREQCLVGLETGLNANSSHAKAVAQKMSGLFQDNIPQVSVPTAFLQLFFAALKSSTENRHHYLSRFGGWLNALAYRDPERAMAATEIYLGYVKHTKPYLHDYNNNLTQLMTCLFSEAEEREESDHGEMLQRVVLIQDMLLSLGLDSINTWLKDAERP